MRKLKEKIELNPSLSVYKAHSGKVLFPKLCPKEL